MRKDFSVDDVARICRVSRGSATRWLDSGKIKSYRIPTGRRDRRVTRDNLVKFMRENDIPLGNLEDEEVLRVLGVGVDYIVYHFLMNELSEDEGYRLVFTADLYEAGVVTAEWNPDVVILDFSIGESEAKKIASVIARRQTHDTVTVALTSADRHPDKVKSDFDHAMSTPVNPEALSHLIGQCFVDKFE